MFIFGILGKLPSLPFTWRCSEATCPGRRDYVVTGCTNNQRKHKVLMQEPCEVHHDKTSVCMCGVYWLHKFPASLECHRKWVVALNRRLRAWQICQNEPGGTLLLEALFNHPHAQSLSHVSVLWRYVWSVSSTGSHRKSIRHLCCSLGTRKILK